MVRTTRGIGDEVIKNTVDNRAIYTFKKRPDPIPRKSVSMNKTSPKETQVNLKPEKGND